MKKILVPYDFTESADSALQYALQLGKQFQSEFILLTINGYPVMTPEVGLSAFTFQDAIDESLKELEKIKEKLTQQGLTARVFSVLGNVSDEINKVCKKESVDLVVMGISGHGNNLIKSLAGSSAVAVSKDCPYPVLIVPPAAHYVTPKRMAFACHHGDDVKHPEVLEHVKKFASAFNADLHLIHIVPENHPLNHTEVVIDNYLEHKLGESTHRTFIVTDKKVSQGLLSILKANLVDLIIIEPKKHGFFENLFHQSVTTEIAFHSPVPVLSIH